jgi:hypothetical protein
LCESQFAMDNWGESCNPDRDEHNRQVWHPIYHNDNHRGK